MREITKRLAIAACLLATSCRDAFVAQLPPLDGFYYPVGLAVRQRPGTAPDDPGSTQLAVVSSNFDLRYDEAGGGTVMVVDPDASVDTALGGQLVMPPGGAWRIGSFGGEVVVAEAACPPGWPDCPSACPPLLADAAVAADGAKLILASRVQQTVYALDMDPGGNLSCSGACATVLPIQSLDPYGVTKVCSERGGEARAQAYLTQLRGVNGIGQLTRLDLLTGEQVELTVGYGTTYTTAYNPYDERLFVSSHSGITAPLRWFNPLVSLSVVDGYTIPDYRSTVFSGLVPNALTRDMAVSNDGRYLYVVLDLYDYDTAVNTGVVVTQGGALAVLDLSPSAFNEPSLGVVRLVPTCFGGGQIRVLPQRRDASGAQKKRDLVAITCDYQGSLLLYDDEVGAVVRYLGLNPATGKPILGRQPFGIAVEPIDPRRRTIPVSSTDYAPSPCTVGRSCDRIYVGSFIDYWVNILELDPDEPRTVALVKRIGRPAW